MRLGRQDAHSGTNLFQLALGHGPIAGPLLKQLPLAVQQRIELFDIVSQVRHHSGQLAIKNKCLRRLDGLESPKGTSHLSSPNVAGRRCLPVEVGTFRN